MVCKRYLNLYTMQHYLQWLKKETESEVAPSCPTPRDPMNTRLLRPRGFPGKSTGVGCHLLLQCMKVKSESEVTQSCPTLSDPVDCSPPGSSVHGIFQARLLEWGAIAFSIMTSYGTYNWTTQFST